MLSYIKCLSEPESEHVLCQASPDWTTRVTNVINYTMLFPVETFAVKKVYHVLALGIIATNNSTGGSSKL